MSRGVLLDLGVQGIAPILRKMGFNVETAYELHSSGKRKMQSDLSFCIYAKENELVAITADKENLLSCSENNIPCILLPAPFLKKYFKQPQWQTNIQSQLVENYGLVRSH